MAIVGSPRAARRGRLALLAVVLAGSSALVLSPASAATAKARGIDVSNWQGAITWAKVAAAGYTFAFGKATEGTSYTDPTYSANRSGSEAAGLVFGAYHFARPSGASRAAATASAVAQADYFADVAAPEPGELPPVLDLEATGGLNSTLLTLWTQTWLDEVFARTGIRGFVYSSPSFWDGDLAGTTSIAAAGYRLWIAHWTSNAAPTVPASNWNGAGWTFWQWTNGSSVAGVRGKIDADRMNGAQPSSVAIPQYASGAPASANPPALAGVPESGYLLAAVPGTWTGGKPLVFSYQWQRCDAAGANCVAIAGATAESYRASAADVGHSLQVAVTATSAAGAATAASVPTVAVSPAGTPPSAPPAAITPPSVAGTAQVGQVLLGSVGEWSGSPTSFTYRWQRCTASGASCVTIPMATGSSYTATPDDLGSTLALVVTANGPGGAASAGASPTAAVVPAPPPPLSVGTQTVQQGVAGNVEAGDGRATVSWQPGSVPLGLTLNVDARDPVPAEPGTGVAVSVPSLPAGGFQWPLDVEYAQPQPAGTVLGYSADGRVYETVPALKSAQLPAARGVGSYVDAGGLLHVLTRAPLDLALFKKGGWGDPRFTSVKGPALARRSTLHLEPLQDRTVLLLTRLSTGSQVRLRAWVAAPGGKRVRILGKGSKLGPPLRYPASYVVAKTERDRPGGVEVRLRLNGRALQPNGRYLLRIAAVDPWGRHQALALRFVYR